MNVGEEEGKGHDLVQKTYELFRDSPLKDRFVGNIEGRDIHRGAVDVVVTDGFIGNVVLKLCEGVFEFVMELVGQEVLGALPNEPRVGRAGAEGAGRRSTTTARSAAPRCWAWTACASSATARPRTRAIANALGVAAQDVRVKLNEKIVAELEALPADGEE